MKYHFLLLITILTITIKNWGNASPIASPTRSPSIAPTHSPISTPTAIPTASPSIQPTSTPTVTIKPSPFPSSMPSSRPSGQPSRQPSRQPSSQPTGQPTNQPTMAPSSPTGQPSASPQAPSSQPSSQPSAEPTYSHKPTKAPTKSPTAKPTISPSARPTRAPTTIAPSMPTSQPSSQPSMQPSSQPSSTPSSSPTSEPTCPTSQPSSQPSKQPTSQPSTWPTSQPTSHPTRAPRERPTPVPTTANPVGEPTSQPSSEPSGQPSSRPTAEPTITKRPTSHPTSTPSRIPSSQPSSQPSSLPSTQPTSSPSSPTSQPSSSPSGQPTSRPSLYPSAQPSSSPTMQPSSQPSSAPSSPTSQPSSTPSSQPSGQPSSRPTVSFRPTSQPSGQPSSLPSAQPLSSPTSIPTNTFQPTSTPSQGPSPRPTPVPTFGGGIPYTLQPTAFYETIDVEGTVEFDPDAEAACNPVQIALRFSFTKNITSGSTITIAAPGITSGACYNASDGYDLALLYVPNTDAFTISYYEGTYLDNYASSYFSLVIDASNGIVPYSEYTVYIDRANKLRRSCSLNTSWEVTVYPNNGRIAGRIGTISLIETYPKRCFVFYSNLYFQNALPQFYTGINISLRLGYEITAGTVITIVLPGFTNSIGAYPMNILHENETSIEAIRFGYNTALYNITSNTNFTWSAIWLEGDTINNFLYSQIQLTAYGYQEFNDFFWILIPKSRNHIIPVCGHPVNDQSFKISTRSDYFYVNTTSIDSTNNIGSGCSNLNECNGYGVCDYCTSQCICSEGHGSFEDRRRAIASDFLPDCSSRACPVGPSMGNIQTYSYEDISGNYSEGAKMHRLMECSNNGICNRKTGVCKCSEGFYGAACQKMKCGGTPACSGRGRCQSMRRLARNPQALPLTTTSIYYVNLNQSLNDGSWDSNMGHTCVCDSAWSVGLGSGETQLAEYFGPSCENRRCPSGDDPNTRTIDETDCENKAQTGNSIYDDIIELGQPGNKCHIDCSNRGKCDYSTGVCSCFPGFKGDNCGSYI